MPTFKELQEERKKKRTVLEESGLDAYPIESQSRTPIEVFINSFKESNTHTHVLSGRIRALRGHGKAGFADIEDESGKVQLFWDETHTKEFALLQETLDIGDILEVSGKTYLTKQGQKSLLVERWKFLAKSLSPLPSQWFGLKDTEERFRKRYLDLLLNPEVKDRFLKSAKIIHEIRAFLQNEGFIEVKTPILQALATGALAKPFKTHLNALDLDLVLRIAPELYLKRLVVGGFEKLFEIGEVFRNEGMDRDHNPEFLMLELYWAYQDWEGLMQFTEQWLWHVANVVGVALKKTPWPRKAFEDILKEKTGITYAKATQDELAVFAKEKGIIIDRALSKGKIADEIFKKLIQPHLVDPIFITKLPLDISPFAKKLGHGKNQTARFILYAHNLQLVNGFSEINDPLDQEERFLAQQEMKKHGDQETTEYDKDYVEALSYGMPPTAGLGLGIERLCMALTGASSLREVILFPLMRPK